MPNIKLIQGNCFDILSTLPVRSVDAIICDPPYNIKYDTWDVKYVNYYCQYLKIMVI